MVHISDVLRKTDGTINPPHVCSEVGDVGGVYFARPNTYTTAKRQSTRTLSAFINACTMEKAKH